MRFCRFRRAGSERINRSPGKSTYPSVQHSRDFRTVPGGNRTHIKGGESNDSVTFCQVGNAVLKVCSQSITGNLSYNVARNALNCSRDRVTVSIAPASEGDLLDALESAKGSARLRVEEFLRIVRDEPVQPLEIRVVNASEIGKVDKVLKVSRDDTR